MPERPVVAAAGGVRSVNPKTIVITGGNSGIGLATARAMAARGWRVVITGRDRARLDRARALIARAGPADVDLRIGDFRELASVRALAAALSGEPRIDVLLNNAGIVLSRRRVTADGNDMMLQVNHLAPFLLTNLLLDKLTREAPARIVVVSSRFHLRATHHGFDDFQFEHGFSLADAYARTKLYNVMFTRELARRLAGTGVTANALHPGFVRTRIGRDGDLSGVTALLWSLAVRLNARPPGEGARVPVFLATAPGVEQVSGAYFARDLAPRPVNPLAEDERASRRLWELSAALVGLA